MCSFLNWEKKVKNMLIYIYRYFALQFGVNQKKRREPKNQIFEQAPHDVSWKPDSSGNLQAQFLIYEFVIMIKWEVKHGG